MSNAKLKIYQEMQSELHARKQRLENERNTLVKATDRIAEIDEELAVIATEDAAYGREVDILKPKEEKEAKQ